MTDSCWAILLTVDCAQVRDVQIIRDARTGALDWTGFAAISGMDFSWIRIQDP